MVRKKALLGLVSSAALLAMVAGGAVTANAAEVRVTDADLAKNQTLTVNAGSYNIANSKFKAVPLALYSYATVDNKDTPATTDDAITSYDATTVAELKDAINQSLTQAGIDTSGKGQSGLAYDANNPMPWVAENLLDSTNSPWAGKLRDFFDKLKNTAAFKTAINNGTAMTATGSTATASVRPGIYAIVDTTATGRAAIVAMTGTGINGVTRLKATKSGSPEYVLGQVEYKAHDTTVSKRITAVDKNGQVSSDGLNAAAPIDDVVEMKLTSTVPNWTGYDKYTYKLVDTYSQGLKLLNSDTYPVTVKVDNKPLTKGTNYTLTANEGSRTFTVNFGTADAGITAQKETFPVGAPVEVTYKMRVTGAAVQGTANVNNVNVQYSHNPNNWTDLETKPGNEVKVFVGKVNLKKTDMDGNSLAGAEFQLKSAKEGSAALYVVKTGEGKYRLATTGEKGAVKDMKTDTQGNLEIQGVTNTKGGADNYYLKEVKSPFNFHRLPVVGIHVDVNEKNGSYQVIEKDGDTDNMATVASNVVTVKNARNLFDMPKTGSTWMVIFGSGAAAMLVAAGLLLYVGMRKSHQAK